MMAQDMCTMDTWLGETDNGYRVGPEGSVHLRDRPCGVPQKFPDGTRSDWTNAVSTPIDEVDRAVERIGAKLCPKCLAVARGPTEAPASTKLADAIKKVAADIGALGKARMEERREAPCPSCGVATGLSEMAKHETCAQCQRGLAALWERIGPAMTDFLDGVRFHVRFHAEIAMGTRCRRCYREAGQRPWEVITKGLCGACEMLTINHRHSTETGATSISAPSSGKVVRDLSPHLHSVVLRQPVGPQPCDNEEDF
jgi:hypothetical protein